MPIFPMSVFCRLRFKNVQIAVFVLLGLMVSIKHLSANDRPNVLLICVDDLRPELNCYGVDYIHSPNIDRLATEGRAFTRHFVQAPTCGASRCALLTGRYGGASNNALFARAAAIEAGGHPNDQTAST